MYKMKEDILEEYKKSKKTFHAFRERMVNLVTDLLLVQEIYVHQIVARTKALDSLSKKLDEKGDKYKCIEDITDVVGIRIITYLESDVNAVSQLIEKEFIKDEKNSVDKRKLKADQFGYRSLHIVISLNDVRSKLKEYKRYEGLKCEIQIRSILQHTWAEIEHDLGYKGEVSIPDLYKRSFNRLSALLETADIEFDRLKSELADYKQQISSLISSNPEDVDINSTSIVSFADTNEVLIKTKEIIEEAIGKPLLNASNFELIVTGLKHFKIHSIAELENILELNKTDYFKFVKGYVDNVKENKSDFQIHKLAVILYFTHYLAGKLKNIKLSEKYLIDFFGSSTDKTRELAQKYIDIYKQTVST